MEAKSKFNLMRSANLIMQLRAKLEEGEGEHDRFEQVRTALKEAAPEPFEVAEELRIIYGAAQHKTWCITPKGFALGEGLLLTAQGENISINEKPVTIDALRDAVEALGEASALPVVLYFGPFSQVGHYLRAPSGAMVGAGHLPFLGFAGENLSSGANFGLALKQGIDGGYTPYADRHHPQVEGHAKLTHENGMTVLGIWDRSIDKRGGSHSTYIAVGTFNFATMRKICEMVFPLRWALLANRVEIKLVQSEDLGIDGVRS